MHRRAQGRTRARGTTRERGTRRPRAASRGMFPRNRAILTGSVPSADLAVLIQLDTLLGQFRRYRQNHPLPSLPPPSHPSLGDGRRESFVNSDRFLAARAIDLARAPAEIKIEIETRGENAAMDDGGGRGGRGGKGQGGGGGGGHHSVSPGSPVALEIIRVLSTISEALRS